MKNHFRPDGTSYHLVDYDPQTGEVRLKQTVQGLSDESAWARGNAWGLYGYTMMYEFSKEADMLVEKLVDRSFAPADESFLKSS